MRVLRGGFRGGSSVADCSPEPACARSSTSPVQVELVRLLNLLVIGAATWRVSSMLVHEDGPGEVFKVLRKVLGFKYDPDGNLLAYPPGNVLSCLWCTSVWVAMILYFMPKQVQRVLAVSAIAIMMDRKVSWQ